MERPLPIILEGRVVRLEPIAEAHRAGIVGAVADASAFVVYGPPLAEGGTGAWVDQAVAETAAGTRLAFVVIDHATGDVAGSSSYLDIAPADGRIEIGHTWYARRFQGTAVNADTKLLLLGHAFDVLGATRVTLKTDARNERSRGGIVAVGGVFEGILRQHSRRADGPGLRDVAMFSIIRSEWPDVRVLLEQRVASRSIPA